MNKKVLCAFIIAALPGTVFAGGENNVGSCGWGSKLLDGQSGVASQVLAATTNGTSGNQTFGITSGTSGCTQDGAVKSNWKTAMFIDGNKEKLARDMSVGEGETLASLAAVMGVRDEHKADFYRLTKANFDKIYSSADVSTDQVRVSLIQVLSTDNVLSQYSKAV